MQRLRDEAHRFAIGTHRARRKKEFVKNPLDEIPGIGPARKRALLHAFGTAKEVAARDWRTWKRRRGSTPRRRGSSIISSTKRATSSYCGLRQRPELAYLFVSFMRICSFSACVDRCRALAAGGIAMDKVASSPSIPLNKGEDI